MAANALQVLGFILGVLAWTGMIGTCASPEWRKSNGQGITFIDNTLRYEGLWLKCKAFATGQTHCDGYKSFFIGLPVVLQICRGLMIASISVGFVAIIVTVFGLKCVSVGADSSLAKARTALVGGLLFGISGVLSGAAVSYYAQDIVQEYYNPAQPKILPMYLRFEYGYALFIGWGSLVLGILCGVIMCVTSAYLIKRKPQTSQTHQFRPVSILQKSAQNNQIALQPYRQNPHQSMPQRQAKIETAPNTAKSTEIQSLSNGKSRPVRDSTASSSNKSVRIEDNHHRRDRRRRASSSERSRSRTRNQDNVTVDVHANRPTGKEGEKGLVRSISGSLKQYL